MWKPAVLFIAVASASFCFAEEGTTSLADAIRAVNQQAAKAPESRGQPPLTEDEVVKAIKELKRDSGKLTDAEYQQLQQIAETRRLPKDAILRQFVRYNEGTGVQHGWWVRLMLLRKDQSTYVLSLRQTSLLRRPYTQKERYFQEEVRNSGIMLLNRLVAYFAEDPKFTVTQTFSQPNADRLAEAVKKALQDQKADGLESIYHWEGVDKETRAKIRAEAEQLTKRQLVSVSVSPRRFGGRLNHWQSFRTWDPNLPVLGYIVVEFAGQDGPNSVALEFGETPDGARLVNYVVSRDDVPKLIGKKLSGPVSVSGEPMVSLGDGWYEMFMQVEAPDDLPALQSASYEIWKIRPSDSKAE